MRSNLIWAPLLGLLLSAGHAADSPADDYEAWITARADDPKLTGLDAGIAARVTRVSAKAPWKPTFYLAKDANGTKVWKTGSELSDPELAGTPNPPVAARSDMLFNMAEQTLAAARDRVLDPSHVDPATDPDGNRARTLQSLRIQLTAAMRSLHVGMAQVLGLTDDPAERERIPDKFGDFRARPAWGAYQRTLSERLLANDPNVAQWVVDHCGELMAESGGGALDHTQLRSVADTFEQMGILERAWTKGSVPANPQIEAARASVGQTDLADEYRRLKPLDEAYDQAFERYEALLKAADNASRDKALKEAKKQLRAAADAYPPALREKFGPLQSSAQTRAAIERTARDLPQADAVLDQRLSDPRVAQGLGGFTESIRLFKSTIELSHKSFWKGRPDLAIKPGLEDQSLKLVSAAESLYAKAMSELSAEKAAMLSSREVNRSKVKAAVRGCKTNTGKLLEAYNGLSTLPTQAGEFLPANSGETPAAPAQGARPK